MSSTCSSPQYSPRCLSRSSTSPLSPQTAATTPSSYNYSPKLGSASSFPSPPQSPREDGEEEEEEEEEYGRLEQRFYADSRQSQSPSPPEPVSAYAYSQHHYQHLPPSPVSPGIWTSPPPSSSYVREPSAYDEAVNFYLYSPLSPTSIYYEWPATGPSMPEYSPWTDFSGYPPASAFYGPLPFEGVQPQPQPPCDPAMALMAADPMAYRTEQWRTADLCSVEYSAMHPHRASM